MEEFLKYAPLIVIVMIFLIQQRVVVTPEQLLWKRDNKIEWRCDNFSKNSSLTSGSVVLE